MRYLIGALFILLSGITYGQEKDQPKGDLSGQWRTFFLGTYNKEELKDFYALATGGNVKYVYTFNSHFKLGGALYTSLNTNIQDLTIPDPATGKLSRYEAGLFDVEDLDDRLIVIPGELFLKYTANKHALTVGRMKIISPFVNPQDGRMIPTLEQGLWYSHTPEKIYKIQAGIFNAIAPRSTSGFFDIGNSIGKYPLGRNPDGSESGYAGNTHSDYLAIANIDFTPAPYLKFEVWNYYADDIFNTFYVKPTIDLDKNGTQLAFEWVRQDRVGDGGNSAEALRYFTDASSNVLGTQLSFKSGITKITMGYDYIPEGGRFLFPREWGRESLFSFQKRERSEGTADNHAVVFTYDRTFSMNKNKLQSTVSIGHHWKPAVTDPADNKYAHPDYTQLNVDFFFISEKLKNLRPELLLVYKKSHGDFPENPNFFLNKVDMFQVNFVVNYNF